MRQRLSPTIVIPLAIILVIVLGGGFFIFSQQNKVANSNTHPQSTLPHIEAHDGVSVPIAPTESVEPLINNNIESIATAASVNPAIDQPFAVSLLSSQQIAQRLPNINKYPDEPKRIVVMEYSFLGDALAVGLTPIGIADDNKPDTIIAEFKDHLPNYTSIGSRYQPSLETIADLNPDLIIADEERHSLISKDLNQIAPAVVLKSRGETYAENLQTAQLVGHVVNQDEKMAKAIETHLQKMQQIKAKLATAPMQHQSVQFAIISDKGMWLHGPSSYAGSLLNQLGIDSPIPNQTDKAYIPASLEQLLAADPEWLLIGRYNEKTVFDEWQASPLFQQLKAVKSNQVIEVDPNYWALNRSMQSAEHIANTLLDIAQLAPKAGKPSTGSTPN